ncbi:hypothetical protein FQR65_LT01269 [Abscondita terminalis]|nr:hypothetical protein FQR65_LT01269 [Abscondita terminalis]
MDIHQQIKPDLINKHEADIKKCPLLIADGNLTVEALAAALKLAEKYNIPVLFEPTDVPICNKPFKTNYWKTIKYITPNLVELKCIAEILKISFPNISLDPVEDASRVGKVLANYIPNIIITLGEDGVVVVRRASSSSSPLFNYKSTSPDNIEARHYPATTVRGFINVSGAGDCLASGIVAAMLSGLSEEKCIKVGFQSALCAMFSESAVPSILFDKNHSSWNSIAHHIQL